MIICVARQGDEVHYQHVLGPSMPLIFSAKMRGWMFFTLMANFMAHVATMFGTTVEGEMDVPAKPTEEELVADYRASTSSVDTPTEDETARFGRSH